MKITRSECLFQIFRQVLKKPMIKQLRIYRNKTEEKNEKERNIINQSSSGDASFFH